MVKATGIATAAFIIASITLSIASPITYVLGEEANPLRVIINYGDDGLEAVSGDLFVVMAHKFNRFTWAPQLKSWFPGLERLSDTLLKDPRDADFNSVYALFAAVTQHVYMPYSGSGLVLANNSVVEVPLGDSIILSLADVLNLYAASGVDSVDEAYPVGDLMTHVPYHWGEKVIEPGQDGVRVQVWEHSARGPVDVLMLAYSEMMKDFLLYDLEPRDFFTDRLGLVGLGEHRASLINSFFSALRSSGHGGVAAELTHLLVEWRVEGPGTIYPAYFTDRIPLTDYGIPTPETLVVSSNALPRAYEGTFPVLYPMYPTSYYSSVYDVSGDIKELVEDNTVIIAPDPGSKGQEFTVTLTITTPTGKRLATFRFTMRVTGEALAYVEQGEPRASWSGLGEAVGEPGGEGVMGYNTSTSLWASYFESQYVPGALDYTVSKNRNARIGQEVRITGYGTYGEAIIEVSGYSTDEARYVYNDLSPGPYTDSEQGYTVDRDYVTRELEYRLTDYWSMTAHAGGALPIPNPGILVHHPGSGWASSPFMIGYGSREHQEFVRFFLMETGGEVRPDYYIRNETVSNHTTSCPCPDGDCGERVGEFREELENVTESMIGVPYTRTEQNSFTYSWSSTGLVIEDGMVWERPLFTYPDQPGQVHGGGGHYVFEGLRANAKLGVTPDHTVGGSFTDTYSQYGYVTRVKYESSPYDSIQCTRVSQGSGDDCSCSVEEVLVRGFIRTPFYDTEPVTMNITEAIDYLLYTVFPLYFGASPGGVRSGPDAYVIGGAPPTSQPPESGASGLILVMDSYYYSPGSKAGLGATVLVGGEPVAGAGVALKAFLNGREFWSWEGVTDENGTLYAEVPIPDAATIKNMTGIDLLNESASVNLFIIGEALTDPPLFNTKSATVEILSGVVGMIHNVDFDVVHEVGRAPVTIPWLGVDVLSLHSTTLTYTYFDPYLAPRPEDSGLYYLTPFGYERLYDQTVWDPEVYLTLMLGKPVNVTIVIEDLDNESIKYRIHYDLWSFRARIPPGHYRAYAEVVIGDGERVFRTHPAEFSLEEGDLAKLDILVPVAPILRTEKLVEELREWKYTNADLAYIIESIISGANQSLTSYLSSLRRAALLARAAACSTWGQEGIALILSKAGMNDTVDACAVAEDFAEEVLHHTQISGETARSVALAIATSRAEMGLEPVEELLQEILGGEYLPSYKTRSAISLPSDPWYRLFMADIYLGFLLNRKPHIISQTVTGVKYAAFLLSLNAVDLVRSNKLFLIDKYVQVPIINSVRETLGRSGLGQKLLKLAEGSSPYLRFAKAFQIFEFTSVGETLNIEPTRNALFSYLKSKGIKGLELGYYIAEFFKVNRFVLSTLMRKLDTDVAFEIAFQTIIRVATELLLKYEALIFDLSLSAYMQDVEGSTIGNLQEAMIRALDANNYINALEAGFELVTKPLSPIKNFLRGVGGLLNYVTERDFLAAYAQLNKKFAARAAVLKWDGSIEMRNLVLNIRLNFPQVARLSKLGKALQETGMKIALVLAATPLLEVMGLEPYAVMLSTAYISTGSLLKTELYSLMGTMYGPLMTLLIKNWAGAGTRSPPTRSRAAGGWEQVSSIRELITEITAEAGAGRVNMTKVAELSNLIDDLDEELTQRYLEAVTRPPDSVTEADTVVAVIYEPMMESLRRFESVASAYAMNPEIGADTVEAVAREALNYLSNLSEIDEPTGALPAGAYYVEMSAWDHRNGTLEITIRPYGTPPQQATLYLSSEGAELSNYQIPVSLAGEATVKVNYEMVGNTSTALITANLVAGGEVVQRLITSASPFTDTPMPWTYNTSAGDIVSVGPLTIADSSGAVRITGAGTVYAAILTDKELSVTGDGLLYVTDTDYGARRVYYITAINTTNIVIEALEDQVSTTTTSATTTTTQTTTTLTTTTAATTTTTTEEAKPTTTTQPGTAASPAAVAAGVAAGVATIAVIGYALLRRH